MSPIDSAAARRRASGEQDPAPDGTIDAYDRAMIAGEYSLEIVTGPSASTLVFYAKPRRAVFRAKRRRLP